jgi:hypothetical protein
MTTLRERKNTFEDISDTCLKMYEVVLSAYLDKREK